MSVVGYFSLGLRNLQELMFMGHVEVDAIFRVSLETSVKDYTPPRPQPDRLMCAEERHLHHKTLVDDVMSADTPDCWSALYHQTHQTLQLQQSHCVRNTHDNVVSRL